MELLPLDPVIEQTFIDAVQRHPNLDQLFVVLKVSSRKTPQSLQGLVFVVLLLCI